VAQVRECSGRVAREAVSRYSPVFEKQGFAKWLAALCEFMAKAVHRTKACANELYWPFSAAPFA
jgi:hypothetical protein